MSSSVKQNSSHDRKLNYQLKTIIFTRKFPLTHIQIYKHRCVTMYLRMLGTVRFLSVFKWDLTNHSDHYSKLPSNETVCYVGYLRTFEAMQYITNWRRIARQRCLK